MTKPWIVTITRCEHILSEGLVHAPSVQGCQAKLEAALAKVERPFTLMIEGATSFQKQRLERDYY